MGLHMRAAYAGISKSKPTGLAHLQAQNGTYEVCRGCLHISRLAVCRLSNAAVQASLDAAGAMLLRPWMVWHLVPAADTLSS